MKSSTGAHFIALDHIRALAAFMVFTWHFTHVAHPTIGYPVPYNYVPTVFPLAILDEGHTGVALFMTLSGYLFAKLLDGQSIQYTAFLWNRAVRLLPLLLVVIVVVGIKHAFAGNSLLSYTFVIAKGILYPSLPNGGWSITVEAHFYAILPLFLWMLRKSKLLPLSIIVAAIALRLVLHQQRGEIQTLAYWTIVGRIDQFALGMLVYQFRSYLAHRHVLAAIIGMAFVAIYWLFDYAGGFHCSPSYPSPSYLWIFLPTIEGLAYAIGIAWYDNSFAPSATGVSKFIGHLGEYSYSIYLLHFFVVVLAARFVNEQIMDISNFYLACLWSVIFFASMIVPGYLSFRFIESPFLRLRKRYVKLPDTANSGLTEPAPVRP
jgi:peptidoglycan/LPS O-acetylase OafA/YrhL